jgi:sarcosine oxidase, subunit gamma
VTADRFDATARRSPLAGMALPDGARELPFLAQLTIRLDPAEEAARRAIESVVGPLPLAPNTFHGGPDASVLWLGPDEWLIVGPPGGEEDLEAQLRRALGEAGRSVAIVDVSANRTTIELSGPAARETLERGCPIDLDPPAFGPGHCAQTLVARANVLVAQLDNAPTYQLYVRPSFAAYLVAWLTDAAKG